MKNKILVLVLLAAIILPQVASAAWWNPFSWKIFTRVFSPKIEMVQTSTSTDNITTTTDNTTNITITNTNQETEKSRQKVEQPKKQQSSLPTEFSTPKNDFQIQRNIEKEKKCSIQAEEEYKKFVEISEAIIKRLFGDDTTIQSIKNSGTSPEVIQQFLDNREKQRQFILNEAKIKKVDYYSKCLTQ